jgi:hypothetical protein
MQKISSYLYPNRVEVVADVDLFPTRWKIVYQNRLKIYQGVDNVITFDVKNTDQKRIDISEMILKMSITDVAGKQIAIVDVEPKETTGLATATITEGSLTTLDPQFLSYALYRINDDETKTVVYADANFGAFGQLELVGSVVAIPTPARYITSFNPDTHHNARPPYITYYSDAVEVRKPNWLNLEEDDSLELDFKFNKGNASVTVQFTRDATISSSTIWEDIIGFGVTPDDVSATKEIPYPIYNRDIAWMRVKFVQTTYNGIDATFDIAKINGTEYSITLAQQGERYSTGEVYRLEGRLLGGDVADSPNGSWQITIDLVNNLGQIVKFTPLAEMPIGESATIVYRDVPLTLRSNAKVIDKVTVRL